nr:MAG TPA: hypothetical protein [Caudoviricetes sp.]
MASASAGEPRHGRVKRFAKQNLEIDGLCLAI